MGIVTINELALSAFAVSEAVNAWRELVINEERGKEQTLVETRYVRTVESYQRAAAADMYSRQAAANSYLRQSAQNTYSRQTAQNSYNRQSAQNSYMRSSAMDYYSRQTGQNIYSQSSYQNSYSRSAGSDSYSRTTASDYYSRQTAVDSYQRSSFSDSYSRQSAANYYGRGTEANTYTRQTGYDVYTRMSFEDRYTRTQMQDSYTRSLFRNTYTRSALQNTYSRQAAQNSYNRQAAANSYSRVSGSDSYSQSATQNSYSRSSAQNSYSRATAQNSYSRQAATNGYYRLSAASSYNRQSAQNSYSRADSTYRVLGRTNYSRSNSYSRQSAANSYYRTSAANYYNRSSAVNSYSRSSAQNSYSQSSAVNSYSRATGNNSYSRQTAQNYYSRSSAVNSYSRQSAVDSYARVAHVDYHEDQYYDNSGRAGVYVDYYARQGLQDSYSRHFTQDVYSRSTARDSYSRSSYQNYYSRQTGLDSYSRSSAIDSYSRSSAQDYYGRQSAVNYYSRSYGADYYSRSAGADSYTRTTALDSYTRNTEGQNVYARQSAEDSYSRQTALDSYVRNSASDSYTRKSELNTYTRTAAMNVYNPAKNEGFDSQNYIPSKPAIYELEGTIVSGQLDVRIASYDKNADGFGDQAESSIIIKYDTKLRRVEDEEGNFLPESISPWIVLKAGSDDPDMNFDIKDLPDGEYELSTIAYNVPRSENGVTKTYVSEENITHFTLMNHLIGADLVILNTEEFYDYIYGKETYVNRADEIKKYAENVLYSSPATLSQQKGLFLVIDLKDEDIDTYHEVKAGLKKDGIVVTPTVHNVVFPGGNTAGDKTGYVFIPLNAMLTGSYDDVTIELSLTEYYDVAHTSIKGNTATTVGVSSLKEIIYIGMDDAEPVVNISDPGPKAKTVNVAISASDVGLGLKELSYQIVESGESPVDGGWISVMGNSKNIEFNNPGKYDIYVKAVDLAGNQTIKKQENIDVAFINVDVDTVRVIKPGDSFDVTTTVITDLNVTDIEYHFDGDSTKVHPDKTEDTPIGDYDREKYEGEMVFPPSTPNGQHIIVVEITFDDGSKEIITKPIRVVDTYGTILGSSVDHTPAWEQHRLEYNANYDPDRAKNVFWAGEAFVVTSDIEFSDIDTVNEGCLLEKVYIEGTPYVYDFTEYINSGNWMHDLVVQPGGAVRIHQSGNLFDETMLTRFGAGATLTFRFEYTDGSIRYETVIVDSTTEYFLYHRAK